VLKSPPFSLHLLPWRPLTKPIARDTWKWTLGGGSLLECGWHVEVPSVTQVYRYYEICEGITNDPV